MKKPFIFITNDDGVNARGLKAVTEVALRFGRVVVIAPETTQSGMAHAVTMYSPLYLRTVEKRGDLTVYACSGTPVDCVKNSEVDCANSEGCITLPLWIGLDRLISNYLENITLQDLLDGNREKILDIKK